MGYSLVDVFVFWEYFVTCFDKKPIQVAFFAEYVDVFLKLKQESSGYPFW